MKNIVCVKQIQQCFLCNTPGFFGTTPNGADYNTCPCCGNNDYLAESTDTKIDELWRKPDEEFQDDMRTKYLYCVLCGILFKLGCTHAANGCTDDVYNGHFIKRWKNKCTGEIYEGMPCFDNANEWYDHANDVEVLALFCPHNDNKCKKSFYPTKSDCNLRL
jgi:hypothetical protein